MTTLRLEGVARDFQDGGALRRVLYPIDLAVPSGELTVLSGPSGSGKTTLVSIMGLVLQCSEGRLFLDDQDLTQLTDDQAAKLRLREYGFVFQQAMLIEGLTVAENILLSMSVQGHRPPPDAMQRAQALLESLGLAGAGSAQPKMLSGGMKQRASIARALIKDPSVLLCDEPTSALDAESGRAVMEVLRRLAHQEQRIVVVVSHDARVFPYADRLIKLESGVITSDTRGEYTESVREAA